MAVPGRPFLMIGMTSSPLLVAEDELRPQQVDAAELSAARVGAVARAAEAGVLRLAALEHFGRRGRALMRRKWWRSLFTILAVRRRRRRRFGWLLRIGGLLRGGRGRRLSGGVLMTRTRCQTDADDQSQTH